MPSDELNANPPLQLKFEITFQRKEGTKFSASKFAKESGLEAIILKDIVDAEERHRRTVQMYRLVHEMIKLMKMSNKIELIGVDRFERNGGRGKPPRVYKVLEDITFTWSM